MTGARVANAVATVAVALTAFLGLSTPALAQEDRVAAPNSPAGYEYALPLDRAREQAAPVESGRADDLAGPGTAAGTPLFGIGVSPSSPAASGADRTAGDVAPSARGHSSPSAPAPGQVAAAQSTRDDPTANGGSSIVEPFGIALAVVGLGGVAGLLLRRRPRWGRRADVGLALTLAAGCGLAPAWGGLYALSAWAPVALALIAALAALVVAGRPKPPPLGLLALAGLGLLAVWATLSTGWAESADQALVAAGRWLLYAVLLALLLLVVRDDRAARRLVMAGALATAAFAGYLCIRLALPGSGDLFLGGRLDDPLGYVNGQGGHLLLALWPALAVAEAARRPQVAGAALAVAVILVGLMLLSQARAVALAGLISVALLLAVVPGRRRRAWCLVTLALGVALAAGPLLDVYGATSPGARRPDEGAVRVAVLLLCGAGVAAGTVWGLLCRVADSEAPSRARRGPRAASGIALALVGLAIATSVAVAVGDPAERAREGVREFKALDVDATRESSSRFASGGGNRYDYWRIATDQFGESPFAGVGAGNYDVTYFERRRTTEDVRQPHSLPLQALSELGLPGLLGVLLLVAGPLVAFARRARRAGRDRDERLLAVAAGGTFVAWLAHTSVDWLHLIPAVTGIALCAVAALVARSGAEPAASVPQRSRGAVVGGCLALLLAGAVLITGPLLADRHVTAAQAVVASDPAESEREARAALRLNAESLPAHYALAAAQARQGDYAGARATLLAAAAREPHDFVTWGLLGDLASRRGDIDRARAAYRRAARLNPRDPALRALAGRQSD